MISLRSDEFIKQNFLQETNSSIVKNNVNISGDSLVNSFFLELITIAVPVIMCGYVSYKCCKINNYIEPDY